MDAQLHHADHLAPHRLFKAPLVGDAVCLGGLRHRAGGASAAVGALVLVHPDANKTMIKEAVERMFEGTKVAKVNTMNCEGKNKRRGMVTGKTAKTKKAIVQLTADSKDIEIFAGL